MVGALSPGWCIKLQYITHHWKNSNNLSYLSNVNNFPSHAYKKKILVKLNFPIMILVFPKSKIFGTRCPLENSNYPMGLNRSSMPWHAWMHVWDDMHDTWPLRWEENILATWTINLRSSPGVVKDLPFSFSLALSLSLSSLPFSLSTLSIRLLTARWMEESNLAASVELRRGKFHHRCK